MRRYMPYLATGALVALAITVVVTRPEPPGLSDAELADIRSRAKSLSQEELQVALEKWVEESQSSLPRQLDWGRSLGAAAIHDRTVELDLRLAPDESATNSFTVIDHFDGVAAELCQQPKSRLVLEAEAVVMMKIERADGSHITYYRLSKDRCRG